MILHLHLTLYLCWWSNCTWHNANISYWIQAILMWCFHRTRMYLQFQTYFRHSSMSFSIHITNWVNLHLFETTFVHILIMNALVSIGIQNVVVTLCECLCSASNCPCVVQLANRFMRVCYCYWYFLGTLHFAIL